MCRVETLSLKANNIEEFGIDLTIDQTKELIDFLQEMLIFLENNGKV